jgi:ribose transport system permease protein
MTPEGRQRGSLLSRLAADYGILLALAALCLYFSAVTYTEQFPTGAAGGQQLAADIARQFPRGASVLIVARDNREDAAFADTLQGELERAGMQVAAVVKGQPADAREALEKRAASGQKMDIIACNPTTAAWAVFDRFDTQYPALAGAKLLRPRAFRGSNFLKTENLLNIANQIAVIAIIAIGMTLVIITGGIDLSVGSLLALSAVVATLLIRDAAGGERATVLGMVACSLAAILLCAGTGFFSGLAITLFQIPAFIVTLAMMLVASGMAYIAAKGQSIYQIPASFVWLGRGADFGLPNAVVLTLLLYLIAHIVMARTRVGRYIYAVGSNPEASRLSGVPNRAVLLFVYTLSGALAGLGGIVMASQLNSGAPTYGQMYELYVIAAVVVGGTSLSGGQGKIVGTLLGALLIAVIQNGMNLTGVESYTQKVVLGLVILGAVLLDRARQRGGDWLRAFRRG